MRRIIRKKTKRTKENRTIDLSLKMTYSIPRDTTEFRTYLKIQWAKSNPLSQSGYSDWENSDLK
jgi:hypothetical protein